MKLGPPFFPAKNGLGHMFKPKFSVKKLWPPLPTSQRKRLYIPTLTKDKRQNQKCMMSWTINWNQSYSKTYVKSWKTSHKSSCLNTIVSHVWFTILLYLYTYIELNAHNSKQQIYIIIHLKKGWFIAWIFQWLLLHCKNNHCKTKEGQTWHPYLHPMIIWAKKNLLPPLYN